MAGRFVAALVVATLCGLSARARADDGPAPMASMEWKAGLDCISQSELERSVEAILGRSVFARAPSATVHLRGQAGPEASPDGRIFAATIEMRDATGASLGARHLRKPGASCRVLDGALAVVVSLLVDAGRSQLVVDLPADPRPEPTWGLVGAASASFSVGLLPSTAWGLHLAVGVEPASFWPVVVDAWIWPTREGSKDGFSGSFLAWHAGLGVCPTIAAIGAFSVHLCVSGQLGEIRAAGVGLPDVREARKLYGHGDARFGAVLGLFGPLELVLTLGAAFPFIRDEFYVNDLGSEQVVHRPGAVVPIGTLGLRLRTGS